MGRGKKFLSLFLAVAMTITGINFGAPSVAEAAESAVTMPKKLAHFSFDENVTDGTAVVSGDDGTGKTVTATPSGSPAVDTETKRVGAGALKLVGSDKSFLTIMGEDNDNLLVGREQLTFSFWCKNTITGTQNWVFFASKNDETNSYQKEHYIGMTLTGSVAFERWNNDGTRKPSISVAGVNNEQWNYVTVVMDKDSSQVYINGSEKKGALAEQPKLTDFLTADSRLHLGKANWENGEYYTGWIDEFSIYDGALTAEQAQAEYDAFFKPVTVNFKCGDEILETRTVRWYDEGAQNYTYELKDEDQVIIIGNDAYLRAQDQGNLTISDSDTPIDVTYTKAQVKEVTGTYAATTRVGIAPKNLPSLVTVKFEGTDVEGKAAVTWDVTEESYAEAGTKTISGTAAGKPATLTLTVEDKANYMIANYAFDDDFKDSKNPEDASRTAVKDIKDGNEDKIEFVEGLSGKAVVLPGGDKGAGAIKLPDNLLSTKEGQVADDFTVSAFIKRESTGNSFAISLLGDTADGKNNYIGLINHNELRMEYKTAEDGQQRADAAKGSAKSEWSHFAMVVKSSEGTIQLYQNGLKVAEKKIDMKVKPSQFAQQNNFLGRATWPDPDYAGTFDELTVYSTALEQNEIQDICDTTLYDAQLAKTKEALEITFAEGENENNVTGNMTLPTTGAGLGTSVEWATSDDKVVKTDGRVMRPSKSKGDATITLTATIKVNGSEKTEEKKFTVIVKALDTVSFEALKEAIKDAETLYNKGVMENIYKSSSLEALKEAIDAAKLVADKENQTGATVTDEEVDNAADAVMAATAKGLELKSFEELNKTTLLAWYPLTEDASDKTGNKSHDGDPGANISYSREMGATFTGGEAFDSCIKLPVENLTVADRMTFSFWAYDERGERSNAFGLGSGDVFGSELPEGKTYAHLFYINTNDNGKLLATMNPKYWAGGTAENINTTAAPANTWHHIVCVMDGTEMTLYVNGEKVETKDVKYSLRDMWNADPDTRWAYIGNCGWANNEANRDKDYKGSIKDFRVYNTALADSQVAEITEYMNSLPMEYAKSDLLAAMKAHVVDGKNRVNVTASPITLPRTGAQEETITWTSDKDNINVEDGTVTFPQTGSVTVKLTAVITLKDGTTANVEFECVVAKPAENVDTTALQALVDSTADLDENDYLAAAWQTFMEKLEAANSILELPMSQEEVDQAKDALQAAITALENAKRGDKTELLKAIQKANLLVTDETLPYPQEARDALQEAIRLARTVNTNQDATQAQVDQAVEDLEAAIAVFEASLPLEDRPATSEDKNNLKTEIAEAEGQIDTEKYTEAAIADFNAALDALKEVAEKEGVTKGEIAQALTDLENAVNALKATAEPATDTEKKELTDEIEKAETIDASKYSEASVAAYNKALAALKEVAAKEGVTKGEIAQALADLQKAVAALEASNDPAGEEEKEALSAEITKAETMDMTKYPQNAVDQFKAALAAIKAITEKEGVTKGEIAQALEDLKAALADLEKSTGTTETIDKSGLAAAIAGAQALVQSNYTAESWALFANALTNAQAVYAKADANQQEVNGALAALTAAQSGLQAAQAPAPQPEPVKVSKVTITNGKTLKIAAGKKVKLAASVAPSNAGNKTVSWSIAKKDQKYATVNSKGQVTTKKAGAGKKVTVTATAKDGSGKKATIKITIMKNAVTKVTLKAKTKNVKAGKKLTIKATVKVNGKKANKTLSWSVDNKSKKFASINKKGVLTTKKAGKGKTVTVTAVSTDGTNKKGTIKIKITK